MSAPIIAPIQLDNLYILDSKFHIESAPADDMELHLDVSCQTLNESLDSAEGRMEINLVVACNLANAKDENDIKMAASTTVYAAASAPLPDELDQDKRREYMKSNLISFAYAHAKSHIMSIAALSPMNGFILPAILPSEMVKQRE